MKTAHMLCISLSLAFSTIASELKQETVKENKNEDNPAATTKREIERTKFLRDGKHVASIVKSKTDMKLKQGTVALEPIAYEMVQFFVSADTWVEVSLKERAHWRVVGKEKVIVDATKGSITVFAPDLGYFEGFFFAPAGRMMSGTEREQLLKGSYTEDLKKSEPR